VGTLVTLVLENGRTADHTEKIFLDSTRESLPAGSRAELWYEVWEGPQKLATLSLLL